eukprot:4495925-Prymnesium_polylepis.2
MLLEPDGIEMMSAVLCLDDGLHFSAAAGCTRACDDDGEEREELRPGGKAELVTPANVHDYVALLSEHYLCGGVRKELASLLSGFWDVVPLEALQATG